MKLYDVAKGSIVRVEGELFFVSQKKEGRVLLEGSGNSLKPLDGKTECQVVLNASDIEAVKNLLVPPDRQIIAIQAMSQDDLDGEGWERDNGSPVILLADSTKIYASRDEEGNGPGVLFTQNVDGTHGILETAG